MLGTPTWLRPHPVILACTLLVAAARPHFVAADPGGIEALSAATPTVRVTLAPRFEPLFDAAKIAVGGCSDTIPSFRCFESSGSSVTGRFLNVGSFFDRRRPASPRRRRPQEPRTSSSHYFIKFFDPQAPTDTIQVQGLSFESRTNYGQVVFPGSGAIVTSVQTPRFPTAEQLANLQQLRVRGATTGATCVDLSRDRVLLFPGEAAWMVLNFPDAADSVFVGVLADSLQPDHACDFMSPNAGLLWYRPDPASSPTYDWAFTVHAAPRRRTVKAAPQPQHWTTVKALYR